MYFHGPSRMLGVPLIEQLTEVSRIGSGSSLKYGQEAEAVLTGVFGKVSSKNFCHGCEKIRLMNELI